MKISVFHQHKMEVDGKGGGGEGEERRGRDKTDFFLKVKKFKAN